MKNLRGIKSVVVLVSLIGLSLNAWAHTDITPQEAKDMIDTNEDLIVVDVREEQIEYCDEDPTPPTPPGHILGALNYPWISEGLQESYSELPIDGDILVVCRSGHRSNLAAEFLDSKGFQSVYDMLGGMSSWEWETVLCIDSDSDGVNDDLDKCPFVSSPSQEDVDGDGIGDVCDNCPDEINPNQTDTDGDCIGDACDDFPNDYDPTQPDSDGDGIGNVCDNCLDDHNPNQEDTDGDKQGNLCDNCADHYNPNQEDTYPPLGNGIGDACECEADFDCNGNVDAEDVTTFLTDFGRNQYNNPCEAGNQCHGDFDCNSAVDADDVTKFLEDFGRNQYNNQCPACEVGGWCVYQ